MPAQQTTGPGWDGHLLFAPLSTLSPRARRLLVAGATLAVLLWCAALRGRLMIAWGLPDVSYYRDMATGHMDRVPQPFSSRPLAPLLAHGINLIFPGWDIIGFGVLAYLSLLCTVAVVFWLLARTAAPRWTVLALAAVPFWPQLLIDAGLPDPLYAALFAVLLVLLERGWLLAAAAMMLPLMLARESTSLTLLCLLLVGWRRMGWRGCGLAVACTLAGSALVRHHSAGGMPNPEHLSGGVYMAGKIVSNSLRSVGILPWSNVYPELCGAPVWQMGVHIGGVRSFGVCAFSPLGPSQVAWALCTAFGLLLPPVLLGWGRWRALLAQGGLVLRFCLLYGAASLVLAPALGTWYLRLIGYAWPLALVAVPRLLADVRVLPADGDSGRSLVRRGEALSGAFLLLHLLSCALGTLEGLPSVPWALALETGAIALVLVQISLRRRAVPAGVSGLPAC